MRVWLVTVGEPLPFDGKNVRLLRTAQFAAWLADQGHEVTFWTGTMDHAGRRLRSNHTTVTSMQPNYTIVQLSGREYRRAVSFRRILNHRDVAKEFSRRAPEFLPPDVILASYPTEELCRAIINFAARLDVPVVVDVRDLWPEIFAGAIPSPLRFAAPILLAPFEAKARRVFKQAFAITGPARSMVTWGLRKAGREWGAFDFSFPFTYPPLESRPSDDKVPDFIDHEGWRDRKWFCFFGALSTRYNLEMVVDCFKSLDEKGVMASAVICGAGDAAEELRRRAHPARNIIFPGWIELNQIRSLMEISSAGIFPYNTEDYFKNLPNKVCEYLAGGLPILSCTDGEIRALIERTQCGFWHAPTASAMEEKIVEIMENPALIAEAAAKARETHAREFERNAVFRNALSSLENVIDNFRKKP